MCTRPADVNGLGLSVAATERYVKKLSRIFAIVPDSLQTFEKWLELVVQHSVVGAKVHDARLVAVMKVHGIGSILTFNVKDSAAMMVSQRFTRITSHEPMSIKLAWCPQAVEETVDALKRGYPMFEQSWSTRA